MPNPKHLRIKFDLFTKIEAAAAINKVSQTELVHKIMETACAELLGRVVTLDDILEKIEGIQICEVCGGSGFSGMGTTYGDVCGNCIAGKVKV